MKLTFIFLTVTLLQVGAKGISQTITYSGKNVKLETVFTEIKKQTDVLFFYSTEDIAIAKPVTISLNNSTLEEALKQVMANQPLTYIIRGNTVFVKKRLNIEDLQSTGNLSPDVNPPIDITGKVTDADGNPLMGANVKVTGNSLGTTTNNDGVFILKGVDENATLEISFVGYQAITIPVNSRTSIVTSLKIEVQKMNEVVINKGYYTEQQKLSTGNVTKVTAKEIEKQPVNNVLLALQGLVPGMQVVQSTGLPGSGVTVRIRGQNSLIFGNDPLYIIDGVPYSSQRLPNLGNILGNAGGYNIGTVSGPGSPFSYINPASIESIDVLKDADATAIYGARGANGVVVITTKKGKQGKTTANFNIQSGWGNLSHKMDLLDTKQYVNMRKEGIINDGRTIQPSDFDLALWDTTKYTDWQEVLLGGTASYTDAQASLSGGTSNLQFLIGTGYHKETTVFPGDLNDKKNFLNFNISSTSQNQKFHVGLTGEYGIDNNHLQVADLTTLALMLPPDAPPLLNSNGSLNWATDPVTGLSSWNVPLAVFSGNGLAYQKNKYNSKTNNVIGNGIISYKPFKGFEIKTNLGYTNTQTDEYTLLPFAAIDPAVWATRQRSSSFSDGKLNSWIIEPQANYEFAFHKNRFNVLLGSTIQQNKTSRELINGSGYLSDLLIQDIRSATTITANTVYAMYKYNALFARLNYNYDNKYLINLTARRDGTSRFIGEKQFHNFGAVGAGWLFSNENFIANNLPFLSYGKLRASYGTTGSDQVGDYSYLDLYNSVSQGVPYQGVVVLQPNSIYTPELEWEETRKMEAALELGLFKDKIFLQASFYRNESSNQLVNYSLPAMTGFTTVRRNLPATVENKGFEFELKSTPVVTKSFKWNILANLTMNRNKLTKVAPGLSSFYNSILGHSLSSNFYYKFLGVDPNTGFYQVADAKGIPTSTPTNADRTVLIDQAPKYFAGIQNMLSYGQWQFDFLFQFVNQVSLGYFSNGLVGRFSSGNQPITVLDRWQKPGDMRTIQKFGQSTDANKAWLNSLGSDRGFMDGSYVRLKNVSLSWSLPLKWQQTMHLQNTRIYMHGQNLLTFTKYNGLDPETRNSTTLPPLRVITFGIQVGL